MQLGTPIAAMAIAAAFLLPQPAQAQRAGEGVAPKGPLNTLRDIYRAIYGCWTWPPDSEIREGMDFTVMLSFKRNGEIFGGRITYQAPNVSADEQALYYGTLMDAVRRCSPLPVSESLGAAIAGRPLQFRFEDPRRKKKGSI